MDTLHFAIIGCGAIAEKHGQALSRIPGAVIAAVADVREDRARAFAARYAGSSRGSTPGREPLICTDYRPVLDSSDVDAVIVATPSGLHAGIGLDAISAHKHVLIEKPLTLSSADARALIDKAREVGVCLGTVHPNRYYPSSQMAHRAIREGRLGTLSHVTATLRWNRTQAYYDEAPWRKTRAMDGGVLFNQAWHAIDVMLWLAGSPVAEVKGMAARRLHDIETEDVALAVLRFEDGALGIIEATTNVYPRNLEQTVGAFGGTGTVVLGGTRPEAIRVWKVAGDDEAAVLAQWGEANAPKVDPSWPHEQVIRSFISAVRADATGPLEEVLTAVDAIDLIEKVVADRQ